MGDDALFDLPGLPATAPDDTFAATGKHAVLSDDGLYRYTLGRALGSGQRHAVFVMLNPSTADAYVDDPTIRRCIGFTRAWGIRALTVVNLYAFRTSKPAVLWEADKGGVDVVGPDNDYWLTHALDVSKFVDGPLIAAWGAHGRPDRVEQIMALPGADRFRCLAYNKDGSPGHPLYQPADTLPIPWRP